jgi:hypothetical protein
MRLPFGTSAPGKSVKRSASDILERRFQQDEQDKRRLSG